MATSKLSAINSGTTSAPASTDQIVIVRGGTTDLLSSTNLPPTISAVSSTTYTLALTDANTIQDCSNASTQTITIPLNATVAFPVGTVILFEQNGVGGVTVTAAVGVTLNGNNGGSVSGTTQYSSFYIRKESTNTWYGEGSGTIAIPNGSVTPTQLSSAANTYATGITIDGAGSTFTTGSKGFTQIPYNCTIANWTVLADQSGSIVLDVKRSTYSGFPTTSSIVGTGNSPILSSAQKNTAAPSGWTSTTLTAGDCLEFSVTSVSGVTRVNLVLQLTKV